MLVRFGYTCSASASSAAITVGPSRFCASAPMEWTYVRAACPRRRNGSSAWRCSVVADVCEPSWAKTRSSMSMAVLGWVALGVRTRWASVSAVDT
jgi:hypothetical protein